MIIRGLPPHLTLGHLNVEPIGDGLRQCSCCQYLHIKAFVCTCGHILCADCVCLRGADGEAICSVCQSVVGYHELELKEAFLRRMILRCSCQLTGTIDELREHLPCGLPGEDFRTTLDDNRANLINERLDRIQRSVQNLQLAQAKGGPDNSKIHLWLYLNELIEQHVPSAKPQHRTFTRLIGGYDLRLVAQVTAVQGEPHLGLMLSSRVGDPLEDRSTAAWPIRAKIVFKLYDREGTLFSVGTLFRCLTHLRR